ncbi:MAG: sensor histidine kinase [Planctomycetaceae bacterium]
MKRVTRQLLSVAAPYLALIAGVFLLDALWIEPQVLQHFRRETTRELQLRAAQMRATIERAQAQLRLFASASVFQTGEVEPIVEELRRLESQSPGRFESLGYFDGSLRVYAADGSTNTLKELALAEVLEAGRDIVSDVHFSRATGKPVFLLLVPVTQGEGQSVGYLMGELPIADVVGPPQADRPQNSTIQLLRVGRTNQFVTAENVVTAAKLADFHWPLSDDPSRNGSWNFASGSTSVDQMTGTRMGDSVAVPPLNASLIQLTPRREVLGPTRTLRTFTAGFATLAMLGSLFFIVLENRMQSVRLEQLKESLQRFGAGNDTIRLSDRPEDEIGQVSAAFNCMAEDVLYAQRKLRKQLAEQAEILQGRQEQKDVSSSKLEELERYAAAVAHDVRAPLATMQGFVAGLTKAAQNGDWERFQGDVERIQRTGTTLQTMLEALLEYARLDRPSTETTPVSLNQAADEAVEWLRGAIESSRVVIVRGELPTAQGDLVRWRQVFQNLIDNAVKACAASSGGRVEIGCEQRSVPGKTPAHGAVSCCFVRDDGIGLNPDQLRRLFEPLSSGPARQVGLGLGLALVKRIIERQGGVIWAESAGAGQGTTVWWTVPT